MKKWALKEWLEFLQAISIIIGVFFIGFQIKNQTETLQVTQKVNSASFVLKISDDLDKPRYEKIMYAIEDHAGNYPIINTKGHKGKFNSHQIEDYIGKFDTIGFLIHENVILETMAYNELGYDVEKTWCNKDVYDYLIKIRQQDKHLSGDQAFYNGFEEFAKYCFFKDKIKSCSEIDEE